LVTVPPKVLYDATGERLEYALVAPKGEASVSVSFSVTSMASRIDEHSMTDRIAFFFTGRNRHSMP
jgi:hypothetical protein